MSDQTVTSKKVEIWDWTGPKPVKILKLQIGPEQGRQKLGPEKGQKSRMARSLGFTGGTGSLVKITDLLPNEISRRATFSSFYSRLRYNLEVMRLKNFEKFENFKIFQLQRFSVV